MMFFNRRKQHKSDEIEADYKSSVKVSSIKSNTHKSAEQANKDIQKLNRLLRANGITLRIHIAAGGHNAR